MTSHKTLKQTESGDLPELNLQDWDAPSKICNGEKEDEVRSSSELNDYINTCSDTLTFQQIIELLEEKIQNLLKRQDNTTAEAFCDLRFIQRQTRYSSDLVLNRRIVEHIIRCGIAHVYLRIWQSLSSVEYLLPENNQSFRNLQIVLSVVWNCTDKSAQLCESLVRGAVVHSMLSELAEAKLVQSDLSDENRVYLVKAYLGVLHNIVRLCPDSRKIFRTANAVGILRLYLDRPQGLVRTKAYLILSYVISEDENDLINATDENIAYIVGILCDALDSENHFSQVYAFWALEIACGINHLAVNDSNKLRLGRLGALPLYVTLLRSNNVEEQSLAAAGLWILSFRHENKLLMVREPGCVEALQFAAANSSQEGICRAARGALWVIKSVPKHPRQAVSVAEDPNAPHVMISYQWQAQKTMILVKKRLKAEGFKVWMDIDNMSGSTLEAMALAVERAAVILVCMSQGYKDSPSCRTEAEYTYRLHKDIIPLVLQPGYVPDGWLGILVGAKLYFDLSKAEVFDRELDRLMIEIGSRGKLVPVESDLVTVRTTLPCSAQRETSQSTEVSVPNSASSMHSYLPMRQNSAVIYWSRSEVHKWLDAASLSALIDRFREFDGRLLMQYKKMMLSAPQFFYHSLENLLHLELIEILNFSQALDELE